METFAIQIGLQEMNLPVYFLILLTMKKENLSNLFHEELIIG